MSLLHTLSSFTTSIRVYAKDFRWGFGDVVEELGLYKGDYYDPEQLVQDLAKTDLFPNNAADAGKKADMVILGTCEIEYVWFYLYRCNQVGTHPKCALSK